MMTPTVGLTMIVKNEEHTLPRLAASLRGQLNRWTIVDTGSSDRTCEVAQQVFDAPGTLLEEAWRGYGPSRNVALRAAAGCTDWLLTLDADETVEGDVRAALDIAEVDAVEAQQHYGTLSYWLPRLLRADKPWEWRGRAHEHLSLKTGRPRMARTEAFTVRHHADGGNRADKLQRELELLQLDLSDDPGDPRTMFYLGRTYDDLVQPATAAAHYRRRLELGGWEEERWYAQWRLGVCLLRSGAADEGVGVLLGAWDRRPERAEPLWALAEHYRLEGRWRLSWEAGELARRWTSAQPDGEGAAPTTDRLFVHDDVYRWRLAYERSICAWYLGHVAAGRRLCHYLLSISLPSEVRQSVETNLSYYR
jgi:glycosyltransferase involved in cell wall biosynthesis